MVSVKNGRVLVNSPVIAESDTHCVIKSMFSNTHFAVNKITGEYDFKGNKDEVISKI